jgi:hypothetical protein
MGSWFVWSRIRRHFSQAWLKLTSTQQRANNYVNIYSQPGIVKRLLGSQPPTR